jgi:hypothetical protein
MTFTTDPVRTLDALDKDKALRVENGVYVFDSQTMNKALSEVSTDCFTRQPPSPQLRVAIKCLAAFPDNLRFVSESGSGSIVGIATSIAMFSESFSAVDNDTITGPYSGYWLSRGAETFIHEMGHVQSLGHANCGGVDQVDSDLYDDGSLGPIGVGYDSGRNFYFQASRGGFHDMMSYCGNGWMSDKGYRKVIAFKSGDNDDPAIMARSTDDADGRSPRMVYLAKHNGQWKAFSSPAPHELTVLSPAQVSALLPAALIGLKVSVYSTDAGPMLDGPYYLSNTLGVLSKLRMLGVAESALRQLNSVGPTPN